MARTKGCNRCKRKYSDIEFGSEGCEYCQDQEWMPIIELVPNSQNPRKISKKDMKSLVRSIEEHGFVEPIIVNIHPDRKDIIVGGHQRVKAAEQLGMKEVPVSYVNLEKHQESALNIGLNKIGGTWDDEKITSMLQEITESDTDELLTGFDDSELKAILSNEERTPKNRDRTEVDHIGHLRIECPECGHEFKRKQR